MDLSKLISFVQSNLPSSSSSIQLLTKSLPNIPLNKLFFKPLSPRLGSLVFVDAGNAELLEGANISVQFLRFYTGWYENNKCTRRLIEEFFLVVLLKNNSFEVALFSLDGNILRSWSVDAFEPSLSVGARMVSPVAVVNYIRTLLEFERLLVDSDIVVRDGDLEANGPLLIQARKMLESKNQTFIGLSKTSSICTDSGDSALSAVRSISPGGSWTYFVGESPRWSKTGFVKLHPDSDYVFRCDLIGAPEALSVLAANSVDLVFLGYPFGLVEADKFAQVTSEERNELRLRFELLSRGEFKSLSLAVDAHDILNAL